MITSSRVIIEARHNFELWKSAQKAVSELKGRPISIGPKQITIRASSIGLASKWLRKAEGVLRWENEPAPKDDIKELQGMEEIPGEDI